MIEKLDPLDQRPSVIIEKLNEVIDAINDRDAETSKDVDAEVS